MVSVELGRKVVSGTVRHVRVSSCRAVGTVGVLSGSCRVLLLSCRTGAKCKMATLVPRTSIIDETPKYPQKTSNEKRYMTTMNDEGEWAISSEVRSFYATARINRTRNTVRS